MDASACISEIGTILGDLRIVTVEPQSCARLGQSASCIVRYSRIYSGRKPNGDLIPQNLTFFLAKIRVVAYILTCKIHIN